MKNERLLSFYLALATMHVMAWTSAATPRQGTPPGALPQSYSEHCSTCPHTVVAHTPGWGNPFQNLPPCAYVLSPEPCFPSPSDPPDSPSDPGGPLRDVLFPNGQPTGDYLCQTTCWDTGERISNKVPYADLTSNQRCPNRCGQFADCHNCTQQPPIPWEDSDDDGIHDIEDADTVTPTPEDQGDYDDWNNQFKDYDGDGIANIFDATPVDVDAVDANGDNIGRVPGSGDPGEQRMLQDGIYASLGSPGGVAGAQFFLQTQGLSTSGVATALSGYDNDALDLSNDGAVFASELAGVLLDKLNVGVAAINNLSGTVTAFQLMHDLQGLIDVANAVHFIGNVTGAISDNGLEALIGLQTSLGSKYAKVSSDIDAALQGSTLTALAGAGFVVSEFAYRFGLDPNGSPYSTFVYVDDFGDELSQGEAEEYIAVNDIFNTHHTGDPVNPANGAFAASALDIHSPGRGLDFNLRRVYDSQRTTPGMFGWGWRAPLLECRLVIWPASASGTVSVHVDWGANRYGVFNQSMNLAGETLWEGTRGEFGKIRQFVEQYAGDESACEDYFANKRGFVLREPNGMSYFFCPPVHYPGGSSLLVCHLRKVSDRYGNAITFRRNAFGYVTRVIGSLGNTWDIAYAPGGHRAISVTDDTGQVWDYKYDEVTGDLLSVEAPARQYADPTANTVGVARPIEVYTYSEHPDGFALNPEPRLNHNLIGIASGLSEPPHTVVNYFTGDSYERDRVQSVTYAGSTEYYRYFEVNGAGGEPDAKHHCRFISGAGVLEDLYFDELGLLLRVERHSSRYDGGYNIIPDSSFPGEPTAWITQLTHNDYGLLERQLESNTDIFPLGRTSEFVYDVDNPDRFQQGNVLVARRLPTPGAAHTTATSFDINYEYDPVTATPWKVEDSDGVTMRFSGHQEHTMAEATTLSALAGWDVVEHSNPNVWIGADLNLDGVIGGTNEVVLIQTPPIPVAQSDPTHSTALEILETRRVYNALGQTLEVIDPSGRTTEYVYGGGRLYQATVDAQGLALATYFSYTPHGQVSRITQPDGQVSELEYEPGGLQVKHTRLTAAEAVHQQCGSGTPSDPYCLIEHGVSVCSYYDLRGNPVGSTPPMSASQASTGTGGGIDNLAWIVAYDGAGRPVELTRQVHNEQMQIISSGQYAAVYDGDGNVTQQVSPLGLVQEFQYSASGDITRHSITGPSGQLTLNREYRYSGLGDLLQTIAPTTGSGVQPDTSSFEYDGFGRKYSEVSPEGLTNIYTRDPQGRVLSRTLLDGQMEQLLRTNTVYDAAGRIRWTRTDQLTVGMDDMLYPANNSFVYRAFGFGRADNELLWEKENTCAVEQATCYQYDSAGRLVGVGGPAQGDPRLDYELDSGGRPTLVTTTFDGFGATGNLNPSTATSTYEYDGHGYIKKIITGAGDTTRFSHDRAGRVRGTVAPDGVRRRVWRQSDGRVYKMLVSGGPGNSLIYNYAYDIEGNRTQLIDAGGAVTDYQYDPRGNLLEIDRDNGTQVVSFEYDAAGRLIERVGPGDLRLSRDYHPGGAVKSTTYLDVSGLRPTVSSTTVLNRAGELLKATETTGGGAPSTIEYSWDVGTGVCAERVVDVHGGYTAAAQRDGLGRLLGINVGGSSTLAYEYDHLGRLEDITRNGTSMWKVQKHYGLSGVAEISLGNGKSITRKHDPDGRLRELRYEGSSGTLGQLNVDYLHGRVSSRERPIMGLQETPHYDPFSRLSGIDQNYSGQQTDVDWTYDDGSNRETTKVNGGLTQDLAFSQINRLQHDSVSSTNYSFDLEGNEVQVSGGAGREVTWDAAGRPIAASYTSSTGQEWVTWTYDAGGRLRNRTDSQGENTLYSYFGSALYGRGDSGASPSVLVPDPLTSGVLWSSSDGGTYYCVDPWSSPLLQDTPGDLEQWAFSPWGELLTGQASTGLRALPSAFAGGDPEPLLGLQRLGVRLYDPSLGRFISQDPIGSVGGPNLYLYGAANPMAFVDTTGFSPNGLGNASAGLSGPAINSSSRFGEGDHYGSWGEDTSMEAFQSGLGMMVNERLDRDQRNDIVHLTDLTLGEALSYANEIRADLLSDIEKFAGVDPAKVEALTNSVNALDSIIDQGTAVQAAQDLAGQGADLVAKLDIAGIAVDAAMDKVGVPPEFRVPIHLASGVISPTTALRRARKLLRTGKGANKLKNLDEYPGRISNKQGARAEDLVSDVYKNGKNTESFIVNGNIRIPDFVVGRNVFLEVKNVAILGGSDIGDQLTDYAQLASRSGGELILIVDEGTHITQATSALVDELGLTVVELPLR